MAKKRTPSGPRLSSGEVVGWTPEKEAMAYNLEQKYGLPEGTIQGMSYRESQFGKLANRPGSQYQSEFQLGKAIRGRSGVTNTRDFQQTAEAAAKYAAENQAGLRAKLGREPTREELYMGHQQGLGGASKLITHPGASAASQIGSKFANANGGRGMSSQQFIDKHSRAFNEGIKQGDNQLWNDKASPAMGDKQQLASRGGEQPTVMAALERLNQAPQQTQVAKAEPKAPDNLPAWAKTQIAQNTPPKGSVLNDINPKDPSGPLLNRGQPTQMASVGPNDFGRGIPASNAKAPSMNPRLEQPTQMALLNPNDMGKGIPASGMQTPPMNPQLQQPAPMQLAALGLNDFGRGVPAGQMPTPPMNPRLEQPAPTQMAALGMNDFGKGMPASHMATPSMNPQLEAPPMQLASVGQNDFAGGIPTSNAPMPPFNMALEQKAPYVNPNVDQNTYDIAQLAAVPQAKPNFMSQAQRDALAAPATSNAPAPVQVASFSRPGPSTPHMPAMAAEQLHAPIGGGGGAEGFAGGMTAPAQMASMDMPQQMAGDMGGEFSLASLFGDAFGPQQQDPFMMADAGFGGGGFDAGGGFGDLGSLFGGLFA